MPLPSDYRFAETKKLSLILAPFAGGQGKDGVENGPQFLIEHGITDHLNNLGWETEVVEPLNKDAVAAQKANSADDQYENCKRPKMVGDATKKIYEAVKEAAHKGNIPVTVGGDHLIAIGTVAGSFDKHPDSCLLWIDAHADINTPLTTESGNLHGCPVSFLMGLDPELYPPELKWVPKCLSAQKIAYIGLRDVDAGEKKILREHNIPAFLMYHVDKYGISGVVQMALDRINPDRRAPIHLSYDVDAIDPLYVPATGTPVRGGLTLREGLFIAEEIAATGLLSALDIVEVNPALASHDLHVLDTVLAGVSLAKCAMGETLL